MNRRFAAIPLAAMATILALGCDPERGSAGPDTYVLDTHENSTDDVCPQPDLYVADVDCAEVINPEEAYPIPIRVTANPKDWKKLEDNPQSLETIKVELTVAGKTFSNVAMELHGGFARMVPKLSYRFELPEESDVYLDLFGDGPERQRHFVLKASWTDPTWTRDYLSMYLIRRSGGFAPRFGHAELWINDQWRGLYLLVERIDRQWVERQGLEDDEFNLYKAETNRANWNYKDNYMDGFDLQIGDKDYDEDVKVLLDACSHTPTTDADYASKLEPVLDLQDFVIMQVVRSYAGDMDAYTKNYYLYHDLSVPSSPFRIISWDADATWGNYWDGKPIPADNNDWFGWDYFSPRLLKVPCWRAAYLNLFRLLTEDEGLAAELQKEAGAFIDRVRPVAIKDLALWQPVVSFEDEVERLSGAITTRHQTMKQVIEGLP